MSSSRRDLDVSHRRVRAVTVVVGVGVVVEGICLISQSLELVTEGKRHVVLRDLRIAPHAGLRDESRRLDKLTIRSTYVPDRRVEVIEDKARRRSPLWKAYRASE